MKQRSTTPVQKVSFAMKGSLLSAAILMAAAAPIAYLSHPVNARDYDAEIRAVQRQIDQYNAEAERLAGKANTLENEVAKLNSQKAGIQAQVDLSQAKYDKLVAEIKDKEKEIADNRVMLGKTIADMYVDTDISPLEMLASSNNIGDYVDKQTRRAVIRDMVSEAIDRITRLKKELEEQRAEEKRTLDDLTNQRNLLAEKEAERQKLLNETRGEEAVYQRLSAEGRAKRQELERQQAAELAARARQVGGYTASSDGSNGGYPSIWANAPMNAYVDSWGMYSRQCVSYAAFKVDQAYGNMPFWGGVGNANQWDDNARAVGIPTGTTPKVGSVGVVNSGLYGHVAWVEAVNPNGTIRISHYNVGWNGSYAVWDNLDPRYFDTYIYFGEW